MSKKVIVVTGTRADYGILKPLLKALESHSDYELTLLATGSHLSEKFGYTLNEIYNDGFKNVLEVALPLDDLSAPALVKSMGIAMQGFSDAYHKINPDLIIYLGDRYEILCASLSALMMKIPTAHIAGGDITEGAHDDAIRHSLTKMSHLHFVTNENSRRIVLQLGEESQFVYNVGHLALDNLLTGDLIDDREAFFDAIDFEPRHKNIMVTFHPETLSDKSPQEQVAEVTGALQKLSSDIGIIITLPNAEPASDVYIKAFLELSQTRPYTKAYTSLGSQKYLSALKYVDAVVGNSSSGLLEVPSFGIPTVNIGDRQKGRMLASSVISCVTKDSEITLAIVKALGYSKSHDPLNPYGDGKTTEKIIKILDNFSDYKRLLKKSFYKQEP